MLFNAAASHGLWKRYSELLSIVFIHFPVIIRSLEISIKYCVCKVAHHKKTTNSVLFGMISIRLEFT